MVISIGTWRLKMNRYLFLDIDGVLNKDNTSERCKGFIGIDTKLKRRFDDWLSGKDVKVVLSSSWRLDQDFVDHLNTLGFNFVGHTKKLRSRGDEIEAYVIENGVERYAILDDCQDFLKEQRKYWVRTSPRHGLQRKHLEMVDKLLGYS